MAGNVHALTVRDCFRKWLMDRAMAQLDDTLDMPSMETIVGPWGLDPEMTVAELREALAIREALTRLRWDEFPIAAGSWQPESAYDMERMLWQFARGEL